MFLLKFKFIVEINEVKLLKKKLNFPFFRNILTFRETLRLQPNCTREPQKSRMGIIHMGSRSCQGDVQAATQILQSN